MDAIQFATVANAAMLTSQAAASQQKTGADWAPVCLNAEGSTPARGFGSSLCR
jgi:hypothetical protein